MEMNIKQCKIFARVVYGAYLDRYELPEIIENLSEREYEIVKDEIIRLSVGILRNHFLGDFECTIQGIKKYALDQ